MRTQNPALNSSTFADVGRMMGDRSDVMTINGTVNKTAFLLGLCVLTASYAWSKFDPMNLAPVNTLFMIGMVGSILSFVVIFFKKTAVSYMAPSYALFEGLLLGGLSAKLEAVYPNIVMQAVGLTFGTLFGLLLAYKSGMIKVTENFKLGIAAAMGGIMVVYLASFILGFFGMAIPMIHESGIVGIGFSMVVVVVAALKLVLDFDFIEEGAEKGAPKFMEWYGAFGLLVGLVWLYIEILILLSKLRDRR
jgi:uncharacterized YccA/Bax inhibitor family protein